MMLQKNETLSEPEGPADAPAPEAVPASTKRPTRWLWIVGTAAVVVLAAAALLWWLLDSTVSEDLYDETVAELDASEEALSAAQDDVAALQAEVDTLRDEVDELRSALTAETDRVTELEALNEALQNQLDAVGTPASDQVRESLTAAVAAASSARFSRYDITETLDGLDAVSGEAAIDLDAGVMAMTMDFDESFFGSDAPDQVEMILDAQDGVWYLGADAFDFPTEARWVSVEIGAVFAPLGVSPEELQSGLSGPLTGVSSMLAGANEVIDLGVEELDDHEVRHVQMIVDTDELLAANGDAFETVDTEGLEDELPAETAVDFWISNDNQLRRMAYGFEVEGLDIRLAVDVVSIGEPVDIEIPDPQEVVDMADLELG